VSKRQILVSTHPGKSLRFTPLDVVNLNMEASTADEAMIHITRAVNAHNPASLPQ
jgi:hypothetical protein